MEARRGLLLLLWAYLQCEVHCFTAHTSVGDIVGFDDTWGDRVVHKFRGIPYAEAPIGDLRFSPPVPKAPFSEPFLADTFAPACPMADEWATEVLFSTEVKDFDMSEDCLHLNVYVPSGGEAKKAVMVWIHGGAFTIGSGKMYEGTKLAAVGDVVMVTINYRLALLGLLTNGGKDFPGNQLLLDQQLALKWVNRNIAAFGGDPSRVTIFGESAGGGSVAFQMLAPSNEGLFQRVIAESGSALAPWALANPDTIMEYQNTFIAKVGCSHEDFDDALACLRKLPAEEFKAHLVGYPHSESIKAKFPTSPRVDGQFIPFSPKSRNPGERMEDQAFFKSIDLLIGANKYEGSPFVSGLMEPIYKEKTNKSLYNGVPEAFFRDAVDLWGIGDGPEQIDKDISDALWWLYGTSEDDFTNGMMSGKGLLEYLGDVFFYDGIDKFVKRHAAGGPTAQTYLYSFLASPENTKGSILDKVPAEPFIDGAVHGSELGYLFTREQPSEQMAEGDDQLSNALITYWTNFAKTGNPNKPVPPPHTWPKYETGKEDFIELDIQDNRAIFNTREYYRRKFTGFWQYVLPTMKEARRVEEENISADKRNVKTEL